MKIIVTGGAGFIGSNLLAYLLGEGTHELLNIDKLCFPGSRHTIASFETDNNYKFLKRDIVDQEAMKNIMVDFAPDAIFHLAAESHVDRSIDDPGSFINTNVHGTYSLLEAFRYYYASLDSAKQKQLRFIHVSTDEVYGSLDLQQAPFSETTPYRPNSPYAASKAASDHLVSAWSHTYQLPLIITNCSNNYGPCQFPEKLVPLVISKSLAGQPIPVYGKGENIRDWLYVEDHVKALCMVLEKGRAGESYNIGAQNEVNNLDLVQGICDILDELKPGNHPKRDLIQFVKDRPGHDFRYAINSNKIQTELGWSPAVKFKNGLQETIRWYLDNQDWCINVCEGSYDGKRLGLGNQ